MITPAHKIRAEMEQTDTYKSAVSKSVRLVMEAIDRAKANGLTHTVFSVPKPHEHEVRRMFAEHGYKFRPTGYWGGVWQLSDDICW